MKKISVPYYSQWETPGMTLPVLLHGPTALYNDIYWRNSGAETIDEYV
jgi:hypothetical protein